MRIYFHYMILSFCFLIASKAFSNSTCVELFLPVDPITTENSKSAADPKKQRVLDWLAVQREINQKLGFETKLKTSTSEGLVQIFAETKTGLPAVELTVDYWPKKKILTIEYIVTDPYIKRGLAQSLLKAVFVLFPEIEIIQVPSLTQDNELVLTASMKRSGSLQQAVQVTPIYKILSRFGFSQIIPGTLTAEGGFAVGRGY